MSKNKTSPIKENEWRCTECGIKLESFRLPPCPRCGKPVEIAMSVGVYNQILKFLMKHKGSQARIMLGKNQAKDPILLYKLIPKEKQVSRS